jgi:hypothetical protein
MQASRSTSSTVNPRCRPSAVAFCRAYGGGGGPVHQLTEFCLRPPLAQAQGPNVRADNSELLRGDFIDSAAPSGRHVPACQMTL